MEYTLKFVKENQMITTFTWLGLENTRILATDSAQKSPQTLAA